MAERDAKSGDSLPNFAGGPDAARNALGKAFLEAIAADFARNGAGVIVTLREERPHDYLKLVAALVPKEFPAAGSATEDITDDEFAEVLAAVRAAIAAKISEEGSAGRPAAFAENQA